MSSPDLEPLIVGFFCHYCAYASADLAGSMRLQYPPNVRIIRTPCTGRLEVEYFRGDIAVEKKADASPVTIADQAAENVILEALDEIAPGVPVIAEEQFSAGIRPEVDGNLFLVDALDGTRAFVKGQVDFTINVALIVDRVPVFGMILLPANGEFYVTPAADRAARTVLSFDGETSFDDLALNDISTREPDPTALVVSLSNSHPSKELEKQLASDRKSLQAELEEKKEKVRQDSA